MDSSLLDYGVETDPKNGSNVHGDFRYQLGYIYRETPGGFGVQNDL